jgi:hypothetical protein
MWHSKLNILDLHCWRLYFNLSWPHTSLPLFHPLWLTKVVMNNWKKRKKNFMTVSDEAEWDRQTDRPFCCGCAHHSWLIQSGFWCSWWLHQSQLITNIIETSLYSCTLCDLLLSRLVARCYHHCSEYKSPFLGYDMWYDIFVKWIWADTQWQ